MLFTVIFVQTSINLIALGIYPVLFRFLQGILNSFVSLSIFFRSRFFITPLLIPHHKDRELLWLPKAFSATSLPKNLTFYVSHCCIVGGNHAVYAYVIIPQVDEWCKIPGMCLPHLGFLTSQGQTSVLAWLAFKSSSDELERSSSRPSHGHFLCLLQESSLSCRH